MSDLSKVPQHSNGGGQPSARLPANPTLQGPGTTLPRWLRSLLIPLRGLSWVILGVCLGWFVTEALSPHQPQRTERAPSKNRLKRDRQHEANESITALTQEFAAWSTRMKENPLETWASLESVSDPERREFLTQRLWEEWVARDPKEAGKWFHHHLKTTAPGKMPWHQMESNKPFWSSALCAIAAQVGAVGARQWAEDVQSFRPKSERHSPYFLQALWLAEFPSSDMGYELDWPNSESGKRLISLLENIDPKVYVRPMVGSRSSSMQSGYTRPTFDPGWSQFMDEPTWTLFRDRFLLLTSEPQKDHYRSYEYGETRHLMAQDWARYHPDDALVHVQKGMYAKDKRYDELLFEHSKTLPPETFVAFWTDPRLADYNDYMLGDVLYEYLTSHPEIENLVVVSPNRRKLLQAFRDWLPPQWAGTWVGKVPLVLEDIISNFPELIDHRIVETKVGQLAAQSHLSQTRTWIEEKAGPDAFVGAAAALARSTPESQTAELWEWVRSDQRFHNTESLDDFSERFLSHDPAAYLELYEASRKPDPEWNGIYSEIGYQWGKWYEKNPEDATLWLEKHPPGDARDSLNAQHAEELIMEAPTKSMGIAMTFTDPARRFKVLDQLINTWSRHDKPAVEQWLNSANLPEADKAKLRKLHLKPAKR